MKLFTAILVVTLVYGSNAYGTRQRIKPVEDEYNYEEPAVEKKADILTPLRSSYSKPSDSSYMSHAGYSSADTSDERLEYNEKIAEEQNNNAKYAFASAVDDGISDQSQVRQETRDGKKVTGQYSYSDGFFRRTTKYEADENGYRIVSEEVEPIGDGPITDKVNGKADVHTQVGGFDTQYSVHAKDINLRKKMLDEAEAKITKYE